MLFSRTKRDKKIRKDYRNYYIIKVVVETGLCAGVLAYGLHYSVNEMVDNLKVMGIGVVSAFWAEQAIRDVLKYRNDIIEERNEIEKRNNELALENKRLREEMEKAKEQANQTVEQEVEQEKAA